MSEQGVLDGMPRRLFACTPSRLASFDCPRRYRLTYLARPAAPRGRPWAHSTLGAVVHLALARWVALPAARRTPAAGADLVTRAWQHDGFRDQQQSAAWRDRAGHWVEQYLAATPPAAEPIGVERTVAVTTAGLAVQGRVDRIDDRGDAVAIVDYKTGRRPSTEDEARASAALALYALAARRTLRRPCRRVELHHVPTGTIAAVEHTEQSLARHVARAEAIAHDIVVATDSLAAGAEPDRAFPPAPSPGCSWCDFRLQCREGRAASRELQPWDGLEPEPAA